MRNKSISLRLQLNRTDLPPYTKGSPRLHELHHSDPVFAKDDAALDPDG
jgi:hypothetical protein